MMMSPDGSLYADDDADADDDGSLYDDVSRRFS